MLLLGFRRWATYQGPGEGDWWAYIPRLSVAVKGGWMDMMLVGLFAAVAFLGLALRGPESSRSVCVIGFWDGSTWGSDGKSNSGLFLSILVYGAALSIKFYGATILSVSGEKSQVQVGSPDTSAVNPPGTKSTTTP